MNYPISTELPSSFLLFLEYYLTQNGQAYIQTTGQFKPQNDPRYAGTPYNVYSAPQLQFLADSSINNATVISGAYLNGNFIPRGVSGLIIDYQQGRFLLSGAGTNNLTNLSGIYCYKDFNFYLGTEYITEAFLNEAQNGGNSYINGSYPKPYTYVMPAIFVSPLAETDVPFSLGGAKTKRVKYSVTLVTDSNTAQAGARALLTDSVNRFFPILNNTAIPYNYYGDVKNGYYNYTGLVNTYANSGQSQAYIQDLQMNSIKSFRGKILNFDQFYVSYGIATIELYNYITPQLL